MIETIEEAQYLVNHTTLAGTAIVISLSVTLGIVSATAQAWEKQETVMSTLASAALAFIGLLILMTIF